MASIMLKSILNDARLNSKISFSIILLPPSSCSPFLFDYLASHVIQVPFQSSLNYSNSRLKKKLLKNYSQEYQWLFPINESVAYKTHNGYILHNHVKAKIIHTYYLYTDIDNDTCTHMLLYLDRPLVANYSIRQVEELQPTDLRFKEMLNNNDITNKIDKLVLKFCDTSVQCDSLKSLHDCMESILDDGYNLLQNLNTAATDLDTLFGSFESYIMDSTYDVAFFKITQLLLDQDKKLTKALEDMEQLDFSQIGLPSSITDERNRVHCAISEFERIGSFRTPAEKLDCLLNTVSELTRDATNNSTSFLDSDSLIPLLLITLIRSKVPHLTANLVYMKEYTFERNIITGKYGYALSTFEGVLDYILEAHSELSQISKRNLQYWSALKTGDMNQLMRYDTNDAHDIRDAFGNNALMMACIHHQPKIVEYLLSIPVTTMVSNDLKKTPLMLAIEFGKSIETVQVLLSDSHVIQSVNNAIDKNGNTALLYACSIDELDILKALMEATDHCITPPHTNSITGDSMLHVASRSGSSIHKMKYIMDLYQSHSLSTTIKNKSLQTFYHLCRNANFINYILPDTNAKYYLIHDIDQNNCSPLMMWASEGRLDLIEIIVSYNANNPTINYIRVDKQGRTLLHLLSMYLGKGLTFGQKSLDYIIEKLCMLVNVRDWQDGNTPLHIAAKTSPLIPAAQINTVVSFVKALVKHGAIINSRNFKDEHAINTSRIRELTTCLDELHLKVDEFISPLLKQSVHKYSWYLTRSTVESTTDQQSQINYMIKSGQVGGSTDSMRLVQRNFQDFILLKNELLYELPEIFLPTFQNLHDPLLIDLKPPPFPWIDLTMSRLQSFMNWLQYHPILRSHELVISFVRSSTDLQQSFIGNNSFSKRKLLLEKISDTPLPTCVMTSLEEEYFLTYAQKMMLPLKSNYLNLLMTARNILTINQELENEILMVAQHSLDLQTSVLIYPITIETIHVCANTTGDRSYASFWPQLIHASQMTYDMVDGILLSLQRPLSLINQRGLLRESIEQQKEVLRKSNYWHTIFSAKDKKRHIDQDKEKVIENMNELNHIDGQINQSHKMISDELAHFQTIHPKQMIQTIKQLARAAFAMERHKLIVLEQTLDKWSL
ncbi:hypothetical protein EDC94DRAFT_558231 [Helicostylum pulchrum]|nr:hypothetical protein EDC94DRAFT_558231 [Helicostylum pulchrum]